MNITVLVRVLLFAAFVIFLLMIYMFVFSPIMKLIT